LYILRYTAILAILLLCFTFASWSSSTYAQVTTTITGSGLNTSIQHTEGTTTWNIRGGTPSTGNTNLFHSFGDLSVGTGNTAAFQNVQVDGVTPVVTNASAVNNIIGRVTGGNPSNLFGTLDSRGGFPNASLFLINPAGIVFGPGASLNVGGAVHFSTADYLRLGTGNEFFYADLSKSSTLSSAPVTAFGFLGANPVGTQAIKVDDSAVVFLMDTGQNIALVGRDTMNGGEAVPGILNEAIVMAPGSRISLASVGTPLDPDAGGEVSAVDFNPAAASSGHGFATLGQIRMTSNASFSVGDSSGPASGQIVIRGGRLTMDGASGLFARTTSANTERGRIDVAVAGAMTLAGRSVIDAENGGSSTIPGGDILIRAGSLTLTEGSQIRATNSSGNPSGVGGNIDITADTVTLSGAIDGGGNTVQSGLFSGTTRTTSGAGGRIRVTTNELSVLDGAAIDTSTFSDAHAGDIDIAATKILVSGVNTTNGISSPSSTISSRATWNRQADNPNEEQQNTGNGGNIRIQAASLDIRDGGQLNVSTETAGHAGLIDIHADTIAISGNRGVIKSGISAKSEFSGSPGGDGGNVSLTVDSLSVGEGGSIELGTTGGGPGGHLVVNAGEIAITAGGIISSESLGNGTAGSLSLSAQSFTMTDAGSTLSIRTSGPGNGGAITLSAEHALLGPGSTIDSRTSSTFKRADPTMQASGGSINVSVGNNLLLKGGRITASSSGSSSGGQNHVAVGNAGTIRVSAGQVQLTDGAEITSSTTVSSGAGGSVTVAGTGAIGLVQLSGGSIKAATAGSGPAGNIIIAGNTVTVSGAASSIDSSTNSTGNAGNILVQAGQVNLENGGTVSSASVDPATGNAGSITIIATDQFQSTGGKVTTSAANGQGGDITIRSDEMLLNGGATIAASTTGLLDAGNILLVAGDRIMLHDSTVTTSASQASGGNITVQASELVRLRTGQIVSSVQGGPGTSGGDITIDPQAVLLQNNSQILAQAVQGNGGNISITAGVLIVDGTSLIDASSQLGINGQVSLNASLRNVAGVITPLPQSLVSQANLYGQRCAAQKGGQFSSFVQGARDGLPVQPGDFLPSPLIPDPSTFSSGQTGVSEAPNFATTRLGLEPAGRFSSMPFVLFSGCRS
jgi:filamentous hemagglutinin family protein